MVIKRTLDPALYEQVVQRLNEVGQRLTRNREALLVVLADAGRPLTIPDIGLADPALAVSSTYRNLTALEEAGIVDRVVTTREFVHYELAEDLTDHHHHLVCSSCGSVDDVEVPPKLEKCVNEVARDVARRTGFRTERHLLDLIGLCERCA